MNYRNWMTLIFAVFFALAASSSQPTTLRAQGQLIVWNAWQGADAAMLSEIASVHEKDTGVAVTLVQFGTPKALLDKLLHDSDGPDVFLGNHTWAPALFDGKRIAAYCIEGGCPECDGPYPPDWCKYASGDFTAHSILGFAMGAARCIEGPCPGCEDPSPFKPWCWIADSSINVKPIPDVLQAGFMIIDPKIGRGFPYGIPVWWKYTGLFVNIDLVGSKVLPINLEELGRFAATYGVYYDQAKPTPVPLQSMLLKAGQSPGKTGILVASSEHFAQLQKEVGKLVPLELKDFRPPILVQGAYVDTRSKNRTQALDFISTLSEEPAQALLFDRTGHLPANGRTLEAIGDAVTRELIDMGKTGHLSGGVTTEG